MENGVKLYNDRNWPAAIIEFKAAYEARPNANPLLNIALCEKELFHYPKAIAALEQALGLHGHAMEAPDRKAAEDAIKDMRALLGHVVVKSTPPDVTLVVDDEELPKDAAQRPIDLGPGPHKIAARAEGFASAERTVTVASGQTQELTFELVADKALVTVRAPDPRMTISIDQRIVGTGTWSGLLSAGPHLVQMVGGNKTPYEGQILVIAGKPLEVKPGAGVSPKKDELPLRRGFYILGTGSLLFAATHPPGFKEPRFDLSGAYGLRLGVQVNNTAGFEIAYEHSSITTSTKMDETGEQGYRILSDRVGAALRLISPGKTWRFVGTVGGGVVVDGVKFGHDVANACNDVALNGTPCPFKGMQGSVGVDAFFLFEAGLELDIDHVLIDLGITSQFQSTGNLTSKVKVDGMEQEVGIYGSRPIINVGPALRVGYRFW
ncbi:Hypothetical protein A7982_09540 [Minicystis rosea]|nr:Hypothetical protein A7982_09540 [Minicystis rosea]